MVKRGDEGSGLYLGIEIGGTKLQICVGDGKTQIQERLRFTVDKTAGAAGIRSQLEKSLPGFVKRFQPIAVGIGFGGPVDCTTGKICCSHQIEGWSEFPLSSWISGLTGLPVRVDNDANAGALGEAKRGAGMGCNTVFYVTLGSGVGGGLVNNGRIYHGAMPGEAEIGHVRLDRAGTILENRCSGWAVDARIRAAVAKNPKGVLAQSVGSATAHEAKFLPQALATGDPTAQEILDAMADDLAFGLSHVTHLFHPHVIVLGGGLSLIGEPLRLAVEKFLGRYIMKAFSPGPSVALSKLGEDAVLAGALALALDS